MPSYEVTRTHEGHIVERYTVHATSGLDAIRLAPHFHPEAKVAHAFAVGEGGDPARGATVIEPVAVILG